MGQLLSSQTGKRSRLQISSSIVNNPPANLEVSTQHIPNLRLDLENQGFFLSTSWQPQKVPSLSTLDHVLPEPRHARTKSSSLFRDSGVPQLNSQSEAECHEVLQNVALARRDEDTRNDENGSILQPEHESDSQSDERATDSDSISPAIARRGRRQPDRKALLREVHQLLHSASIDDMSQIASYLKIHVSDSSDESFSDEQDPFAPQPRLSRRQSADSRLRLSTRKSQEHLPVRRRSSMPKINTLSTRPSQEHILALKPSSAYLSSLRPSSSYQSSLSRTSSSRSNSLSGQRSESFLPLSRQTSSSRSVRSTVFSPVRGGSSSASSLWSPTSEVTDVYRLTLLTNLHYCTYGCRDQNYKRKQDWIRHEEQIHEPPVIHTCLLHVAEDLAMDPCPAKLCVSVMDVEHLAHFHDAFACFDTPAVSIERYQTEKVELLLEHLLERHGLKFDVVPDNWSSESRRKLKWRCGFCGGILKNWKERGDHISIHFTREGLTMDDWKDTTKVPEEGMVKSNIGLQKKELSLSQSKRLSVVRECGKDEAGGGY